MLVVETIARIRRDHLVRGVPIKKIARDLRVSKNTVRKVVRGDETSYSYERKIQPMDPSRKSGGALHRLHCFCLEFDGACEVQRRVPTDWIIEPIDVSGYGSFSLAS